MPDPATDHHGSLRIFFRRRAAGAGVGIRTEVEGINDRKVQGFGLCIHLWAAFVHRQEGQLIQIIVVQDKDLAVDVLARQSV